MGGFSSTVSAMFANHTGQTYSFKALTGVLRNPAFDTTISFTGKNLGLGSIKINMATARTTHSTGVDGVVIPLYVAGDGGDIEIEVQETSSLHTSLLALYNKILLAAQGGDYAGWAATSIMFNLLSDGSLHLLSGLSFEKFPDKPYQAAGQKITWKMLACNISNL